MKNVTLIALALSFALAACSDSNTGTVSFALTARQAAAPAPAPSAAFSSTSAAPSVTATGDSTLITLGNDSIVIRSAQVVLRKVELKRSDVASCDAVAGNDDCEEFETGATLVTLPLGSTTIAQQVCVAAPPVTVTAREFQIDKPCSCEDACFIGCNADFHAIAFRLKGPYSPGRTRCRFA